MTESAGTTESVTERAGTTAIKLREPALVPSNAAMPVGRSLPHPLQIVGGFGDSLLLLVGGIGGCVALLVFFFEGILLLLVEGIEADTSA